MRSFGLSSTLWLGLTCLPVAALAEPAVGLTEAGGLVRFDTATPGQLGAEVAVTGMAQGETLHAIDARPSTGKLYGLGSSSRLYILDPATGAATAVGAAAFTTPLAGASFGFDFNPSGEAVRVTSDTRQNLRLNSVTGAVTVDSAFTYASIATETARLPGGASGIDLTGIAYTRNRGGASMPALFGIDTGYDELVKLSVGLAAGDFHLVTPVAPAGTPLPGGDTFAPGVDLGTVGGFDVSPNSDAAFAVLRAEDATTSAVWSVNLETGVGTKVQDTPVALKDLAILPDVTSAELVLLTSNNELVRVDSRDPRTPLGAPVLVTGLEANETISGMDFQPDGGALIAVGSSSRVYRIDPATGVATPVGAGAFSPVVGTPAAAGVDFNPVNGGLRVVSGNQNLRLDAAAGTATLDTPLAYREGDDNVGQTPVITAAAYTNATVGATATRLFVLDMRAGPGGSIFLASQGSTEDGMPIDGGPNGGQLSTIGALDVALDPANTNASLAIGAGNVAFAVIQAAGNPRLYQIDLATGAARFGHIIGVPAADGGAAPTIQAVAIVIPVAPEDGGASSSSGGSSGASSSGGGSSGASGSSGTSGASGTSGTSGTSGASGTSGNGADAGASSGTNGIDDLDGGGCDCNTTGDASGLASAGLLAGLVGLFVSKRKKRG